MSEAEFDWSPLGEGFWQEAAATTGATALQSRFSCCYHRGMTASGSARAAGYAGDDDAIRQAGSRAAKSTAVMNLLALAKAESGGGEDGIVGSAEAKRILSRLARGSDPNVRIKALDSLNKLEQAERDANRQEDTGDPTDTCLSMICALPNHAPALAVGMWFDWTGDISSFPYLRQVAPLLARDVPDDWARWCAKCPGVEALASGPVLTSDELVKAVKSVAIRPTLGSVRAPDNRAEGQDAAA